LIIIIIIIIIIYYLLCKSYQDTQAKKHKKTTKNIQKNTFIRCCRKI